MRSGTCGAESCSFDPYLLTKRRIRRACRASILASVGGNQYAPGNRVGADKRTPAALAAKQATTSIPIVFGFAADPAGSRIVPNLAHPGANVTGWTHLGLELRAKYLGVLKKTVPDATRFGVLWNPSNQVHERSLKVIEAAARRPGVEVYPTGVRDPKALEATVSALAKKGVRALNLANPPRCPQLAAPEVTRPWACRPSGTRSRAQFPPFP